MKTYFQLIAELKPFDSDAFDAAQKAKYGSSMAKARSLIRKPPREERLLVSLNGLYRQANILRIFL
jgi:hypothetical protein